MRSRAILRGIGRAATASGRTAFAAGGLFLAASAALASYSGNGPFPVYPNATAAGGASAYHLISAASTNATSVKNSAGTVYSIAAYNNGSTIAYLKFSDSASAPSCGTTAVTQTYLIPANGNGAGINFALPVGLSFANGIGLCVTGGIADNDTTAVTASAVVVDITYK